MAFEKFNNKAASLLDGSITSGALTLAVDSASTFPTAGDFRIIIDDELFTVTAVSTNTFTVTRGVEGTTPAAHSDNAPVTHILTSASLMNLIYNRGISGTLGDWKPSSPGTYDEEFEGTADTLPANWSWNTTPSGSALWSLNSRWPSMLTLEGTGNTDYTLSRASFSPAADFGLFAKIYNGNVTSADNKNVSLIIIDSSGNNALIMQIRATNREEKAARGVVISSGSPSVAFGGVERALPKGQTSIYLGLIRISNVWQGLYSNDGVAWERIGVTTSLTFTVDKFQITGGSGNGEQGFQAIDWVRYMATPEFPRPF